MASGAMELIAPMPREACAKRLQAEIDGPSFGATVMIGGAIVVAAVPSFVWLALAIPIAMLAFGFGHIKFGRYLARDERRFLLEFLRQTMGAKAE